MFKGVSKPRIIYATIGAIFLSVILVTNLDLSGLSIDPDLQCLISGLVVFSAIYIPLIVLVSYIAKIQKK